MKPFTMLCTALMGVCLLSCRAKQIEEFTHSSDSLTVWQWDDVVLIHERLDSVEHKPIERTLILRQSGQSIGTTHKQSKHRAEVKPSPMKRISRWWWVALVAVFALAIGLGIYSAKSYLSKRLMLG